jgi:isoquinoline 1-oxidoreductase subunit alpha
MIRGVRIDTLKLHSARYLYLGIFYARIWRGQRAHHPDTEEVTSMIELNINGTVRRLDVDPDMPLLWALRDHAGLTGTKYGCGVAQCGACTVHIDGQPTRACQTPVSAVAGQRITTVEGASGRVAAAVQASWTKLDVPQCGYCQSGQVMAAIALLEGNKRPSDADIDSAMSGNICRCATYARIRTAIHDAARSLA